MIEQNSRWLTGINHETTLATNGDTFIAFDTQTFDYAEVILEEAPAAATNSSNQCTEIVLQHSTTTDASNATAVTGASTGTAGTATTSQFTMPVGNNTTCGTVSRFFVKLADKERYIALLVNPGNTNSRTFSAGCRLTQGDNLALGESTQIDFGDTGLASLASSMTNYVGVIM